MLDSRRGIVDTNVDTNVDANGGPLEQPRSFQFAVTWSSLTTHLQLREAADRTYATHLPSSALTLAVPSALPPLAQEPAMGSTGRWEMVVPKMVRTGHKTFAPARPFPPSGSEAEAVPPHYSPLFASFTTQPFLARAFSVIGRRTRALLPAPDASAAAGALLLDRRNPRGPQRDERRLAAPSGAMQDRHANRELLLSKIARALRTRPPAGSLFPTDRDEEWRP